ncbi:N-acetyl-gamma-glutamyl-phosphate reductase [Vallitalea okinawensis]|uniref:N-acetyl-gamma-glutamyl-phosphate reductase n=1 Tax=Vallitalea okinawensis TaxID=2078660 RepID=UPI000CFD565B|nr:N-acetyl-gamma-glutamyl-phosphate reductase [Vallitalea okinawensis]
MIKASIIGATGYAGGEILRLLINHPNVHIEAINSNTYAEMKYDTLYGGYKNIFEKTLESVDLEELANRSDVIFMAMPNGKAMEFVNKELLNQVKVIDLSGDFRLKNMDLYEKWYKIKHHESKSLKEAVYGLTEWNRESIKEARLIANPGCYTTCSLLILLPLLKENLIDPKHLFIDGKSGVSGAGKGLALGTHYPECNENIKAYKVAEHRHTPEIEACIKDMTDKNIQVNFTPHLVPMNRGILCSAYTVANQGVTSKMIEQVYDHYYNEEPFIRFRGDKQMPETKWIKGTNYCDIGFKLDQRTGHLMLFGVIDNMMKGAAGQAVQNMNLLFGLEEQMGLNQIPLTI